MILDEIKSKLEPDQQEELLETAHLSIINNNRDDHLDDYEKLKAIGMSY
jgi:UDP-N-acetylmuramate-alanine ligase